MDVVTLLDASDTGRRLLQQGLALAGAALIVAGVVLMVTGDGAMRGLGAIAVVAGVGSLFAASSVLVRWEVPYGGHIVRFENSVVFGERLVIDGERFTAGVLGYRKVIEGEIRRGSRAGTRIRAESVAGVVRFRCKLSVELP
jgi:membrane-bound ClpP family serine protease